MDALDGRDVGILLGTAVEVTVGVMVGELVHVGIALVGKIEDGCSVDVGRALGIGVVGTKVVGIGVVGNVVVGTGLVGEIDVGGCVLVGFVEGCTELGTWVVGPRVDG